jgi:hypothetical protein
MTALLKGAHMSDQPSDSTPLFSAWIASWPGVRRELETMLAAYERHHPAYSPGWVEPVFEMMDTTLYNLSYRAEWFQTHLDRVKEASSVIDDDAFYAMLAEAQVD